MIERINLIEKEPFTFTYTRIIQFVVITILLCVAAYGYQFGKAYLYQKEVNELQTKIAQLRAENKALKKTAPRQIKPGSQTKLQSIFNRPGRWSILIEDVIKPMPNAVWLKQIKQKTKTVAKTSSRKKKKKKSAPATVILEPILILEGQTAHPRHLADYVGALTESPLIREATINNIEKEKDYYKFDIHCLLLSLPN